MQQLARFLARMDQRREHLQCGDAAVAGSRMPAQRAAQFAHWADAPFARLCHPREEHLIPLMVAAGASEHPGIHEFADQVLGGTVSAFRFA